MPLTQAQRVLWERARAPGSGGQAVGLDDSICAYLLTIIIKDLNFDGSFPELNFDIPAFFAKRDLDELRVQNVPPLRLFERILAINPDADTYFACLAALHKARLKYERILKSQPIPTIEQVGPRGLLQYGKLEANSLAGFLFWRKWFFDIDNRAGQETGYLFEPVIASAVGGVPLSAAKSPVRRSSDNSKGRQVDCLLGDRAYEIKIRMTIAASGQGRWGEELDYPVDCRNSGYTPVLVVLDSTPNPKLAELERAFGAVGGEVYIGAAAWQHLDNLAGDTIATFLENYVGLPLEDLLDSALPELPDFKASIVGCNMILSLGDESFTIHRSPLPNLAGAERDQAADDEGQLLI
jgi:hypothetical protein